MKSIRNHQLYQLFKTQFLLTIREPEVLFWGMFRIGQYKWQIAEMLKCDYPRTKIFFPRTLYARFVEIDFEHYTPPLDWEIDDSLIQFSEFLGTFWNKINSEIMEKYPDKKVN